MILRRRQCKHRFAPTTRRQQARPSDLQILRELAARCNMGEIAANDIVPLAADGSDRIFYRLATNPASIAIFPSPSDHGRAEAMSSYTIGCHLADMGVPVPQIYGQSREYRVVLLEDVGDQHLYDVVHGRNDFSAVRGFYFQAVEALLALQVRGRHGFDLRCCWGSRHYDFELMIQQESLYFLNAFCRDYLALHVDLPRLEAEFIKVARQAAREPADFLLHRDFQCRNLMVKQGEIRIIDFQGARLGPLAYDLASLLIDPYARLTVGEQQEIFDHYLSVLSTAIDLDVERFARGFRFLALQRNFQILGAFAFLSQQKGKMFFQQFIAPALGSLSRLLAEVDGDFPAIRDLVAQCQAVHNDMECQG